jgi:ornithine decarboxylase
MSPIAVPSPTTPAFDTISDMLRKLDPPSPVYCVYPHVYRDSTREFLAGFPGRVLYAVKANNDPAILRLLAEFGVSDFDCASIEEIRQVSDLVPAARCYFMNPVWLRGAARAAQTDFGVRHFVIDHADALALLRHEIDAARAVIFARMAVEHEAAREKLSEKFGAAPQEIPALLQAIASTGAEPALAFNVGSNVMSPDAYVHGIEVARGVLEQLPFRVRLLDIGGGFGRTYPDIQAPPLSAYFAGIAATAKTLPLADGGELLAEPGRALSAPGLSAVTRVLLRKQDRIYINDGMYGALWELRCNGQKRYASRCYRDGAPLGGQTRPLRVYGPTCDSSDVLPTPVELPVDISAGDYVEFGAIGAYSLSGRTDFNGLYSDTVVKITNETARPPGHRA